MKKFSAVQSRVNTNRGRPDSNCVTPAANEAEKQEISAEWMTERLERPQLMKIKKSVCKIVNW